MAVPFWMVAPMVIALLSVHTAVASETDEATLHVKVTSLADDVTQMEATDGLHYLLAVQQTSSGNVNCYTDQQTRAAISGAAHDVIMDDVTSQLVQSVMGDPKTHTVKFDIDQEMNLFWMCLERPESAVVFLAEMTNPTTPAQVTSSTTQAQVTSSTTPGQVTSSTTPAQVTSSTTPAQVTSSTTPGQVTSSTTPAQVTSSTTPAAIHRTKRRIRAKRGVQWAIYPGTKWCGAGHIANDDNDLGTFSETDKCCLTHDQCDTYIRAWGFKYWMFNWYPWTISHCKCDDAFKQCLENVNGESAAINVEKIFFDLIGIRCFTLRSNWWTYASYRD